MDAYLREQADEARVALLNGIGDLKAALTGTLDPRRLPRRYPFITMGAVAIAGFAAAMVAIPSREEQELRRLERIRRAMYPEPERPKAAASTVAAEAEQVAKPALWMSLLTAGVQAARPILIKIVTDAIKARQHPPEPPPAPENAPYDT